MFIIFTFIQKPQWKEEKMKHNVPTVTDFFKLYLVSHVCFAFAVEAFIIIILLERKRERERDEFSLNHDDGQLWLRINENRLNVVTALWKVQTKSFVPFRMSCLFLFFHFFVCDFFPKNLAPRLHNIIKKERKQHNHNHNNKNSNDQSI